jgi:hypothetical protein
MDVFLYVCQLFKEAARILFLNFSNYLACHLYSRVYFLIGLSFNNSCNVYFLLVNNFYISFFIFRFQSQMVTNFYRGKYVGCSWQRVQHTHEDHREKRRKRKKKEESLFANAAFRDTITADAVLLVLHLPLITI